MIFMSGKEFYTIVSPFTRILLNNYINNGFANLQKSKMCYFFVSENYRIGVHVIA